MEGVPLLVGSPGCVIFLPSEGLVSGSLQKRPCLHLSWEVRTHAVRSTHREEDKWHVSEFSAQSWLPAPVVSIDTGFNLTFGSPSQTLFILCYPVNKYAPFCGGNREGGWLEIGGGSGNLPAATASASVGVWWLSSATGALGPFDSPHSHCLLSFLSTCEKEIHTLCCCRWRVVLGRREKCLLMCYPYSF